MQIISALRRAGHQVTFSMALISQMAKSNLDKVRHLLTPDDLWRCEHYFEPEIVLHRVQPEIVIFCNINLLRTMKRFAREIIFVVDLNGPIQFEGLLVDMRDTEVAMQDGIELEARCREMVEKLRYADYLITVSERQKYFWAAYCSLAGFSLAGLNLLVSPVSVEVPPVERKTAEQMTVVYAGGFYPWQSPERSLRAAAQILQQIEGAKLHIFGGPHVDLPNEQEVMRLLEELKRYPCVEYHGFRPIEELLETQSRAWCALDLLERNIERELAITGRTVVFLSTGTPVIHNDYSTLSGLIQKYNAGWTISPSAPEALETVFRQIADGGRPLVDRISANVRKLAAEEFSPESSMSALVNLCGNDAPKRSTSKPLRPLVGPSMRGQEPRVLAICQESFALPELRVRNPLRALQRQNSIAGFKTTGITFEGLADDSSQYSVVLIQRAAPEYVFEALVNLGIPYILDVDDNLLARASYRREAATETSLITGLRHATVVTAPTPRLVRALEKYSGLALAHKVFIVPNALPYPPEIQPPSAPKQLLWIQSDVAALSTSRKDVAWAVENFSQRHDLPLILIGRNVLDRPRFTNQVIMGEIDLNANLQLLEFTGTSIGIAPLETAADEETLDFVAGKSDLKMLLFDGYGHPGVYSDSPPYADSPLRTGATLIPNSYSDWTYALEYQFREGWRAIGEQSKRIRLERHIDRVAVESWWPALTAALLPNTVSGRSLYEAFRRGFEIREHAGAASGRLGANGDVADQYMDETHSVEDHLRESGRCEPGTLLRDARALDPSVSKLDDKRMDLQRRFESFAPRPGTGGTGFGSETHHLRQQLADMRNSLSWKITAPLRKLAKPFMKRNHR
jgi:glycosyltransferase involved in cell wall biosynthesis